MNYGFSILIGITKVMECVGDERQLRGPGRDGAAGKAETAGHPAHSLLMHFKASSCSVRMQR